jgi:hypothetical protein
MAFYPNNPNLQRDIRTHKNTASESLAFVSNATNNQATQVNNLNTGQTVNTNVVLDPNDVSNNTSGFITGNGNIVNGSSNIIGGTNNNTQGDNILTNSNSNIITGDNNSVIGGGNNNVDSNGNVLINVTGANVVQNGTTLIGGNYINNTSYLTPLIHILVGEENGFNELKNISFVMGGHNTVRPLWGDDCNHILDGNALNIVYQ